MIKNLPAVVPFIAIAFILSSCGGSSTDNRSDVETTPTRSCSETSEVAVTEQTLKANSNLCATPDKVTVVDFKPRNSTSANDSDVAGVNLIPYKITNGGAHVFSFKDDANIPHYAVMKDSTGNQVFRIKVNDAPVTVDLPAGSYNLFVYNEGLGRASLFIQPDTTASNAKVNPEVQYSQSDADTLLSYNLCRYCDLTNADLNNAYLSDADLTGANLTGANLASADLSEAELASANLTNANLTGADLSFADLSNANISGANFSRANLSLAQWPDGSWCSDKSIGQCNS